MKNNKFDYKKSSKSNKSFVKDFREFSAVNENASRIDIEKISVANKGDSFSVFGVVEKVVQTGGPTIFAVSDGTGILSLKAFDGAGVRAYPHVDVGDAIKSVITVEEYNDELEGEVKKIWKLNEEDKKEFLEKLAKIEKDRAKVEPIPFLVKSPILDKLKDRFVKAATEIRLAVIQSRPIIVRHHNDADGYSAGYALEKAILPLIAKQHGSAPKAEWEFYTRAPCNAPMYELDDSIRDTAHSLSNAAKFSNKMPLIVIVDTGSGKEDLLGIKQGRVHGEDFIVIDHHQFDEDVISDETIVNINPWLVEESGAQFSAGMLCVELARLINPDPNLNILQIPAMAGLADRTDNPEVIESYLKIAKELGYDEKLLKNIASVIDFVSSKLRFMEAREYIEVLFGEPRKKQKALVELLAPHIENLDAKGLKIAKSAAKIEQINNTTLQLLYIEDNFSRGFYPKPGRVTGLIHDYIQQEKNLKNVVTLGCMTDAITMRATDDANFSVSELIEYLNKKIPEAFVEGGGHKNAGSIRFVPSKQKEVLELVKVYIKDRK